MITSLNCARALAVTSYLEQRGIPRTSIMAGYEYDGWTQLEVAGYYNDPHIEKPAGLYIPPPQSPGFVTIYAFWRYTPVVHPDYVVALAPHRDLLPSDVPLTTYSCWLPPFHRCLGVQVRDPALAEVRRRPMFPDKIEYRQNVLSLVRKAVETTHDAAE